MKKYLWVMALALVLSAAFAGTAAAESSHAQQDQAFLQGLTQQAQAPMSLAAAPPQILPLSFCSGYCTGAADCWAVCPGGPGSSYCDRFRHQCLPY
jgi:hypothetical protein